MGIEDPFATTEDTTMAGLFAEFAYTHLVNTGFTPEQVRLLKQVWLQGANANMIFLTKPPHPPTPEMVETRMREAMNWITKTIKET